ncbi:MAG: porin [Rhodobacter sp.]|nr:porin [Rhodobacter sp.]
MKRLLMATTALCLGAGTAAADIALSGSAEMGVAGSKDDSARFHTDIDVTFTMSGATDAGVSFGAAIDIDEASVDDGEKDHATNNDDEDGGIAVHMSQPETFGTITMGDTAGAIAWAVSDARGAGPGSIRDNHEHGGSSGNDGLDATHDNQILRWDRAIGSGFSMAASVEIDDDADGAPDTKTYDPILGVGGTYSMGMGVGTLGLGLGFQMGSKAHTMAMHTGDNPHWSGEVDAMAVGGSVSLDFGDGGDGIKLVADAGVMEADGDTVANGVVTESASMEGMHMGLGLGYTVGAISLGVNVGTQVTEESHDNDLNSGTAGSKTLETTKSGVGFSAAYDLGGGAALQFGVGSSETEHDWTYQGNATASGSGEGGHDSSSDTNSWSLGVAFSF